MVEAVIGVSTATADSAGAKAAAVPAVDGVARAVDVVMVPALGADERVAEEDSAVTPEVITVAALDVARGSEVAASTRPEEL